MIIKKGDEIEVTFSGSATMDMDSSVVMNWIMDEAPDGLKTYNPSWRVTVERYKNMTTRELQDELEDLLNFFDLPDASFGRAESMRELRLVSEITKRGEHEYLDKIYEAHNG